MLERLGARLLAGVGDDGVQRGDRLWVVTITTGGSDQARRDFSDALYTLRLP